jgi:hypothetical protein
LTFASRSGGLIVIRDSPLSKNQKRGQPIQGFLWGITAGLAVQ